MRIVIVIITMMWSTVMSAQVDLFQLAWSMVETTMPQDTNYYIGSNSLTGEPMWKVLPKGIDSIYTDGSNTYIIYNGVTYFTGDGGYQDIVIEQLNPGASLGSNYTTTLGFTALPKVGISSGVDDEILIDQDANNESGVLRISNDSLFYDACDGCFDTFIGKVAAADTQDITKDSTGTADSKVIGLNLVNGGRVAFRVSDTQDLSRDSLGSGGSRVIGINLVNGGRAAFRETDNQDLSLNTSTHNLSLTNDATPVNLGLYLDNTDNQILSITPGKGKISITDGGSVTLADSSATNEIQTIDQFTISSNTLNLSLANDGVAPATVNLSPYLDNTDNQSLSLLDSVNRVFRLSISNGNTVKFKDTDTDTQDLSISAGKGRISLVDGGSVVLADSSATNELQDLSISANILSLTNDATTVDLSPYLDNTDNQYLTLLDSVNRVFRISISNGNTIKFRDTDTQDLSISAGKGRISLVDGGSVVLADSSATNEIQALSISAGKGRISLVSGGSVVLRDSLENNEGVLGVGAGLSSNDAKIISNTTGSNGLTLQGSNYVNVNEALTSSDGGIINFTIPAQAIDSTRLAPNSVKSSEIFDNAVTMAKLGDVATSTVFYRKTSGTGDPETQTLATLKTDLGLTGTNSGDQTVTVSAPVTGGGSGASINIAVDTLATNAKALATQFDLLSKQNQLNGTGFVKASGTSITYDNSTYLTTETGDISGVTATTPLTGGGTSGALTLGIQQAGTSQAGFLSSTDWNTFNGKLSGNGTANYVPFYSTASTLTNDFDFQFYNGNTLYLAGRHELRKSGSDNSICIGQGAGGSLTTTGGEGNINIGIFSGAGIANNASNNFNLGSYAGHLNQTGSANINLGPNAGYFNLSSSNNINLGNQAGLNNTGSSNVNIGSLAGRQGTNVTGCVNIGNSAGYNNTANNRLHIENSDTTTPLIGGDFSANTVGINIANGSAANTLHVGGGARISSLAGTGTRIVGATTDGDLTITTVTGTNWFNNGGVNSDISNIGATNTLNSGRKLLIGQLSGGLTNQQHVDFNSNFRLRGKFYDKDNFLGTATDVLRSNATGEVFWGAPPVPSTVGTTIGIDDPTPNSTSTHAEIKMFNNAATGLGAGVTMTGGGGLVVSQNASANSNGGTITVTLPDNSVTSAKIAANTIVAADIANTGVAAGTFTNVTVNTAGQVTAGSVMPWVQAYGNTTAESVPASTTSNYNIQNSSGSFTSHYTVSTANDEITILEGGTYEVSYVLNTIAPQVSTAFIEYWNGTSWLNFPNSSNTVFVPISTAESPVTNIVIGTLNAGQKLRVRIFNQSTTTALQYKRGCINIKKL